jgi:hypothetical protein
LWELKKNPDYQITDISMISDSLVDPPELHAELWCSDSTPANKKLDDTVIKGWKIFVYVESYPPSKFLEPTRVPEKNISNNSP